MAIMQRQTDVLVMLKTGGGKSMLAIISTTLLQSKEGLVLVLPLKSLMTDWQCKLESMKVAYQVFNPSVNQGRLRMDINLILTTVDKARFASWRTALAELNETLRITRLVFDEAHLVLLGQHFRQSMDRITNLRGDDMQLILLSGTIPPFSEGVIRESFGLLSDTVAIRQNTNCPELEFILEQRCDSKLLLAKATHLINQERQTWTVQDRGLVFVTYLEDGQNLAAKVSCVIIVMNVFTTLCLIHRQSGHFIMAMKQ